MEWSVDVSLNNENVLTVASGWIGGKASFTEEEEGAIKEAAKSLLAFMGEFCFEENQTGKSEKQNDQT